MSSTDQNKKASKTKVDQSANASKLLNPSKEQAKVFHRQPTMMSSKIKSGTSMKKENSTKRSKPKVSRETLHMVVMHVMQEADKDGNGYLDINECRNFLKKLLATTYPNKEWDEEAYKNGFHSIDIDKGGDISIAELFDCIYKNAVRQGMIQEEAS